jgi:protocatechuate 4,5-dioxygenase, alpha chain
MRNDTESLLPISPARVFNVSTAERENVFRARRGYVLNHLCISLNVHENRDALLRDEDAYCRQYGLHEQQIEAVRSSNVQTLLSASGSIYYVAKLVGCFGMNVQDIGAQQTGMSVEAFRAKLRAAGAA